jgi:CRISPR system Cascade subunit CasC
MSVNRSEHSFKGIRIEYHILQSFPVTCLNRDDVGAPKTAMIGGSTRARVSSQCWKRQVRLALKEQGIVIGTRTKLIKGLVATGCEKLGASAEAAAHCGEKIERIFIKNSSSDKNEEVEDSTEGAVETSNTEKTDTLLFLSPSEVETIAQAFKETKFDPEKVILQKKQDKQAKELAAILGKAPNAAIDGLDIALFGRMVAQAPEMNIEAASSFSHAISTHRVANEVEFFTALDDEQKEPGSAHMGSLEFNAATYYRYICLDLSQLSHNLAGQDTGTAVEAFTKALFTAVPAARQATQSGACPWAYAQILVRKGQRLQAPFETAVKAQDGGFLEPSKRELKLWISKQEKLWGSLYGKIAALEYGEDENRSIDAVLKDLNKTVHEVGK